MWIIIQKRPCLVYMQLEKPAVMGYMGKIGLPASLLESLVFAKEAAENMMRAEKER